jgi:diguanylate cyclase (GGDEF)-like protein
MNGQLDNSRSSNLTSLDVELASRGEADRPFERLTSLIKTVLDVPIGAICLANSTRPSSRALQALEARAVPGSKFLSIGESGALAPVVVTDATMDGQFSSNPFVVGPPYVRSCAAVPLSSTQAVSFGMLCAIDVVPRTFSTAQVAILHGFAALATEELELRELADRDQLTGLLTRRGFLSDLQDAVARYERHQRPTALLLLDIDHFKLVNDCFGHAAGDQVLKSVAECCHSAVRLTDSLGRLGGEEFGILLLETGPEEAWLAAERIRQAVAELRFDSLMGLKLTASLGVAPLTCDHGDVAAWAERADEALYAAKRGGRDRTAISV